MDSNLQTIDTILRRRNSRGNQSSFRNWDDRGIQMGLADMTKYRIMYWPKSRNIQGLVFHSLFAA